MDQHIHSLAEAMLATTVGSKQQGFMFPIIDVLDKVSSSSTTGPHLKWKCFLALDRACSAHDILPTRYPSIGNLVVFEDCPSYYGGTADVWRGEVDGLLVAVKVTRRYSTVPIAQAREQFYREVLTWGRLSHPNLLPLLGVDTKTFPLAVISPWMQHGSMREYLSRFPNAPRLKLILDASRGLDYMHGLNYVHGDLKSCNILIDDNHTARLADFGSSSSIPSSEFDSKVSPRPPGSDAFSVRWQAPELIYPEGFGLNECVRSKGSDIYALAMVMYEAFSGLVPFEGYSEENVMLQVMSGARPNRPQRGLDLGLTDSVWSMMQECWGNVDRRWTISCVVLRLESLIASAAKMTESDGRTEPASASEPESGIIQSSRRSKVFHKLIRFLHATLIPGRVPRTNGQSYMGRF